MDVVGIGDLCLDLTAGIRKLPNENGFVPLQFLSWQGGGKVPTAMVTAARLGASAGIIASCGDDSFGKFCVRDFVNNHVDVSKMQILENCDTNFVVAIPETETGNRAYLGRVTSHSSVPGEYLDKEYIQSAKYLHIWKIYEGTRKAIDWIHEAGGKVVIDADRYDPEIEKNLNLIDVFIGSEYFYEGVFGAAKEDELEANLKALLAKGPEIVVITLGSKGCAMADKDGFYRVGCFSGEPIVDTTAAGDVFHGAFIVALLKGMKGEEAARFSSAVSYIKCTEYGGRAGIPDYETVCRFLQTGVIDKTININQSVALYKTLSLS